VEIYWTKHALERFIERALIHGFTRTEIEIAIKKQEIKIPKGFDEKYGKEKIETICLVADKYLTIQKAESKKEIIVITLWESNEKEVKTWFSRQK
jgi:hypothetical protein